MEVAARVLPDSARTAPEAVVWAAAGTPHAVLPIASEAVTSAQREAVAELARLARGRVVRLAAPAR